MSGLPFNTGLCQGWVPPGTNYAVPTINYMSGTYSPAGATTLIAIFGTNFKLYSTIKFGTFTPTMIFISSLQIDFYVPTTASPGIYPVQVFNDIYASNFVNYTLDNAPGFWRLNPSYAEVIENTNYGGLFVNGPIQINNSTNSTGGSVQGNISFNSSNQFIFWNGITSSITANNSSGTPTVYITGDLDVSGNITASGTISDYRIKDIIEPINSSYSVDNLKPIKYFNKKSKKEEIGFIAHEVQEIFPFLVNGSKDGPQNQSLNYIGLIGVLVKEIQDLKEKVTKLEKKARNI